MYMTKNTVYFSGCWILRSDRKYHHLGTQNSGGFGWGRFSARYPTRMESQPFLLHSVKFCSFVNPKVLMFHLPTNQMIINPLQRA